MNKEELESLKKYSLNGDEMMKLNPNAKLIKYTELNDINDIDEMFVDTDELIILYLLQNEYMGHWCTLFKQKVANDKYYNFFDSYGKDLDYQLEILTPKRRKQLDEERNRLNELLKHKKVYYNDIRLQSKGTETCGFFVSHRLANKEANDTAYVDFFKQQQKIKHRTPDDVVVRYVYRRMKNIIKR